MPIICILIILLTLPGPCHFVLPWPVLSPASLPRPMPHLWAFPESYNTSWECPCANLPNLRTVPDLHCTSCALKGGTDISDASCQFSTRKPNGGNPLGEANQKSGITTVPFLPTHTHSVSLFRSLFRQFLWNNDSLGHGLSSILLKLSCMSVTFNWAKWWEYGNNLIQDPLLKWDWNLAKLRLYQPFPNSMPVSHKEHQWGSQKEVGSCSSFHCFFACLWSFYFSI